MKHLFAILILTFFFGFFVNDLNAQIRLNSGSVNTLLSFNFIQHQCNFNFASSSSNFSFSGQESNQNARYDLLFTIFNFRRNFHTASYSPNVSGTNWTGTAIINGTTYNNAVAQTANLNFIFETMTFPYRFVYQSFPTRRTNFTMTGRLTIKNSSQQIVFDQNVEANGYAIITLSNNTFSTDRRQKLIHRVEYFFQ
jgi:hypothetical protein